jgi:hypothetical protein
MVENAKFYQLDFLLLPSKILSLPKTFIWLGFQPIIRSVNPHYNLLAWIKEK